VRPSVPLLARTQEGKTDVQHVLDSTSLGALRLTVDSAPTLEDSANVVSKEYIFHSDAVASCLELIERELGLNIGFKPGPREDVELRAYADGRLDLVAGELALMTQPGQSPTIIAAPGKYELPDDALVLRICCGETLEDAKIAYTRILGMLAKAAVAAKKDAKELRKQDQLRLQAEFTARAARRVHERGGAEATDAEHAADLAGEGQAKIAAYALLAERDAETAAAALELAISIFRSQSTRASFRIGAAGMCACLQPNLTFHTSAGGMMLARLIRWDEAHKESGADEVIPYASANFPSGVGDDEGDEEVRARPDRLHSNATLTPRSGRQSSGAGGRAGGAQDCQHHVPVDAGGAAELDRGLQAGRAHDSPLPHLPAA